MPYQPTGDDMDFIRTQDYIHTDLSWNVTGLLKDMRSKGTKIYFDFSKRYRHEDVPTILKNINYGIFSFARSAAAYSAAMSLMKSVTYKFGSVPAAFTASFTCG